MSSKTSFFNKTLFRSDIKRYWWISAAETLLFIIGCVIPLYNMCRYNSSFYNMKFYSWGGFSFFTAVVFSFGTSIILFNFMHFNGSVSRMHSLPVKRRQIFVTKLISAAAILIVPIIITGIILAVMSCGEVCGRISMSEIGNWVYAVFAYTLVILSLTTTVNMMTGNPVGTVVFTAGFALLPILLMSMFSEMATNEIHGYAWNYSDTLLSRIYIEPRYLIPGEKGIIYPVISIILLAAAYALYRARKSEAHGEVITFKWLTPVFIGVIAALASGLGYIYAVGIFEVQNLLTMFPFGILGAAIAYMISKKAPDFKGCIKPVLVYTALALVFCAVIHFDLTGFEKRVPQPEDVESVFISDHAVYDEPTFTEKDDIENVIALHKYMTKKKEKDSRGGPSILVTYELKGGKTLSREYDIDLNEDSPLLKPVYETAEFRTARFKLISDEKKEILFAEVIDRRISGEGQIVLYPDNEDMQRLVDAVKKDMSAYTFESFKNESSTSTHVGISWNYYPDNSKEASSDYIQFPVYDDAVNTIAALKEIGIYDMIPKAEDIASADIRITDCRDGRCLSEYTVTEKDEITALYDMYDEIIEGRKYYDYGKSVNVYVDYTLTGGRVFTASATYDKDNVPEIFKIE